MAKSIIIEIVKDVAILAPLYFIGEWSYKYYEINKGIDLLAQAGASTQYLVCVITLLVSLGCWNISTILNKIERNKVSR